MGAYEHGNTNDASPIALNANYQTPKWYFCFITLENLQNLR